MMNQLSLNRILWAAAGALALAAALIGILRPAVYDELATPDLLAGILSQDVFTVLASVAALALAARATTAGRPKVQIVLLSIMGYLFYAYAIYAIERMYNMLYFVYLAIMGVSFYAIVYNVATMRREALDRLVMRRGVRRASVVALVAVALLFYVLWAMQLLPLMREHGRLEYRYSIFVLDCALLLPALLITAAKMARGDGLGLALGPAIFLKGFTLLFSVGLGSAFMPFFGLETNWGEMGFYMGIALIFLALGVAALAALRLADAPAAPGTRPPAARRTSGKRREAHR